MSSGFLLPIRFTGWGNVGAKFGRRDVGLARKIQSVMGIVENALAPLFNGKDKVETGNAARVLWAGLHGITSLASAGEMQVVSPQSVTEMTKILVTNFIAGIRVGGAAKNRQNTGRQ